MQENYTNLYLFVEEKVLSPFYAKRLEAITSINLGTVLKRKNPYLFKAKNIETAEQLVISILEAYSSSQEEAIFGSYLEELAIYIASEKFGGHKSPAEGIDLEFERDDIKYIVSIKSGPNWGNSRQIAKMKDDFLKAKRILGTNTTKKKVIAVNGCCYGKDSIPDKGDYLKLCGQDFWYLISDDKNLYKEIILPLDKDIKVKDENFKKEYAKKVNEMTAEVLENFMNDNLIDWEKVVEYVSGSTSNFQITEN